MDSNITITHGTCDAGFAEPTRTRAFGGFMWALDVRTSRAVKHTSTGSVRPVPDST